MQLYNDFTYRKKAEELQQQVAALPAASEVRKNSKTRSRHSTQASARLG